MEKYNRRVSFAITKYNPDFRDVSGAYQKETWTSYSDVGKKFDRSVLTKSEYEKIESRYINSIFLIMNFFKSETITIEHIYTVSNYEEFIKNADSDLYETLLSLKKGQVIKDKQTISKIVKLRLREYIIELELLVDRKSRSEIIFGFDYYMYFKTNKNVESLLKQIREIGLFTE